MLTRLFGGNVRHFVSCLLASLLYSALVAAPSWRPITEADQKIETSGVDTSAGAIVLLREISVDDSDTGGTNVDYYIRMKVLSSKGVEAMDKTEIPFDRGSAVRDLAARVVKADGTIVEVDKKSFYTREIVRVGKESISVKAFAFAGLEPGCIAEYRYRIRSTDAIGGMRLDLDDVYPVALVRIRIRPFAYPGLGMRWIWSAGANMFDRGKDKRGYYVFEGTNIPVAPKEPMAPPDEVTRAWFAFYFTFGDPDKYWGYMAGELAEGGKTLLKPNKKMIEAAESITAGATTSDEKIARLYEYCRTKIKNLSYDSCGYTPEQIEDLKEVSTPQEVLKQGYGTGGQINMLFAALLRALKAECSLVYCGDRSLGFFNEKIMMRSTLPDLIVGLKAGSWRFYDPGALYVPMGRLQWRNEGTTAMVVDGKYYEFIQTNPSASDYSAIRRVANLRLDAEGTLEGEVEITYSGHEATRAKHLHDTKTADESLEIIREELTKQLGKVELSNCVVRDATDPEKPITIAFHVRAEGYAETTAGRMFVQPAFFQKGAEPRFTAAKRKFDIYFSFPTTEDDVVSIDLPAGFEREAPSLPKSLVNEKAFSYRPKVRYTEEPSRVTYQRTLALDAVIVKVSGYGWVKQFFDHVHQQDGYAITLKRTVPAADPVATAPVEGAPAAAGSL